LAEPKDTLENLNAWLDQVEEPVIDAERPIVDPHHHMWRHPTKPYLLEQLWADTGSGHNVTATMFMECGAEYRTGGPEHLRSVGETEFVAAQADEAAKDPAKAQIEVIISWADLRSDKLDETLDAHAEAAGGRFRGIRQRAPYDPALEGDTPSSSEPNPQLYRDPGFLEGLRHLGQRGFTFDFWCFHVQIPEVTLAARAAPDTAIIFDHFGGPLGIGPYKGRRDEYFEEWKLHVAELAECPNVFAKIGGMAMTINGFGWDKRNRPATSDELVTAQRKWYAHMIECFGPERCMFESNFPMDRQLISYPVLWNAFKKIAAPFSDTEKDALFQGTARRVYGLD
jgi:predicted TIM-barrel fold metal-dependent hydrolase